jgi:Fur family ferric uptake transcriptional regulator
LTNAIESHILNAVEWYLPLKFDTIHTKASFAGGFDIKNMTQLQKGHNCKEELRNAELKATPARVGVLEALEIATTPLDVTTVTEYLKVHNIKADKATVFRIMNALSKKGLITPIQLGEGKWRYEHSTKADHHHFICENCSNIEDISDCNIQNLEAELIKKKKLLVKRHSLEFFGLCRDCQL